MGFYQKNCEIIKMRYPNVHTALNDMEIVSANLQFVKNEEGVSIPVACTERGEYRLNSYYNPSGAAEAFVKRYEENVQYKIFAIIGLSDGKYIRKLMNLLDDTNIIILYEPDVSCLKQLLEEYDYTDILTNTRMIFFAGNLDTLWVEKVVAKLISYSKKDLVETVILPNYDILFPEAAKRFIDLIIERIRWLTFQKATYEEHGLKFLENMYCAIPDMMKGYTVNQLMEYTKSMDLSGIPAIIVSAGPSLDKNVHLLKQAKGKAFILVVDAALKAVMQAGVKPDFVVSVDPIIAMDKVGVEGYEDLNLVVTPLVSKEMTERNHGKHFYHSICYPYILQFYQKEGKRADAYLESGGSVANDAFSLAEILGFQTIVLIGQDLAFTGGRFYSKGTLDNDIEKEKEIIRNSLVVEVEGIHGETLQTDVKMCEYLGWFERAIKKNPGIEVIDATEGGALIHGTKIDTLENVIKEKCIRSFDIEKILEELQPVFSEEQQQRLQSEWQKLPQKLTEMQEKFRKGIQAYQQLQEWGKASYKDENIYQDIQQKISEIDRYIESETLIDILGLYNKKEIYELDAMIYQKEEPTLEELAEQGKGLLESYDKAAEQMKEDLAKYIYFGVN